MDTVIGVGSIDLVGKSGRRYRLPQVYYAPTARKQLLSEGQLLICDDMIRTYDRNSHEADKFGLESSDGYFQMDGKVIDYLFYVFEARTSHEAYALTRSEARRQDEDGSENFHLDESSRKLAGAPGPISANPNQVIISTTFSNRVSVSVSVVSVTIKRPSE